MFCTHESCVAQPGMRVMGADGRQCIASSSNIKLWPRADPKFSHIEISLSPGVLGWPGHTPTIINPVTHSSQNLGRDEEKTPISRQ